MQLIKLAELINKTLKEHPELADYDVNPDCDEFDDTLKLIAPHQSKGVLLIASQDSFINKNSIVYEV